MASGGLQDWVFWVTGAVLALGGVLLTAWALFWDRSRGRNRCPKCWYDMSAAVATVRDGSEVFVCPECGRAARNAKELWRTRRRWGLSVAGAMFLAGAYVAVRVPDLRRDDWTVLVPTSVLIFVAPAEEQLVDDQWGGTAGALVTVAERQSLLAGRSRRTLPPPAVQRSLGDSLAEAAWKRLYGGQMSRWQSQVFVGRFLAKAGISLRDQVVVPVQWLAGELMPVCSDRDHPNSQLFDRPLYATVGGADRSLSIYWCQVVTAPEHAADSIQLPLELRSGHGVVYSRTYTVPVAIVEDAAHVLDWNGSKDATELVRRAMVVRVVADGSAAAIVVVGPAEGENSTSLPFGVAYSVNVLVDDDVVGRATGATTWGADSWKLAPRRLDMEWGAGGLQRLLANPDRAKLVVRGDPVAAWEWYRAGWFGKTRAATWVGTFVTPVRIESEAMPR